ncbi:MAG TPA: AAA domain-containing protein [Thermococcaceae archaeon]|nr:AAA domain-containing protein [Thermococcaceae archaeon]
MAHKEEWILKEKEFREYLQKIKELAKKGDSITEEEFKELLNTVNKIRDLLDREVLWLWGSAKAPVEVAHEILSRSDFRELMEIVEEINDIKEIEIDQEIFERILQVMSAPHTKLSTLSSWLFVFNPRVFFPINSYVMNEEALKRLELDKFWVVQKYNKKKLRKVTEEYLRFLSALNIAIEEAEVEDMSEALFYFTKGTGPKGKSITLKRYFDSRGYSYPPHLVSQFYVALKTKGFVILSGLTGTGKTKIAQELAKLLDPSQENFLFLPVRPDWRDSKALLGYYNPLTGEYPRTKLLNFILKAVEDYQNNGVNAKPYFVLLDEMNLAHVEYYFADFLSVLESGREENGFTRESIKLHDNSEVETFEGIPRELKLPPNLYIIGTVNMDETTYAFSPKVLDRAFVVEFHDVDLKNYPPGEDKISQEELEKIRESILNDLRRGGKFLAVRKKGEDGQEKGDIEEALEKLKNANSGKYWQILPKLNKVLEPYDFHFGYRVVDEIALFFENSKESQKNGIIDFRGEDEIFDLALLMKVLPKFHGNRKKLEKPLLIVLKLAKDGELEGTEYQLKTEDLFKMLFEEDKATKKLGAVVEKMGNIEDYKFKHTAKKVLRMLRQLYEIGFASFS